MTAAETQSFASAEKILNRVGEIKISGRHVGRIAREVGETLLDEQRQRAELFSRKELPVEVENIPRIAVVEMDGGRILTRAEGRGAGTHDPAWRESKNALFQRMTGDSYDEDPCPELPDFLENRGQVRQLVLEMSGTADGIEAPPEEERPGKDSVRYEPPQRLLRTCISSLDKSNEFGRLMAAEAHRKGFFEAPRQAFVADGMKCNWTVWKRYFPTFTPIIDLLHVLSYLYHGAAAIGENEESGWNLCAEWTRACWQGRVDQVIEEMQEWLSAHPGTEQELPETDPRRIVDSSLGYLRNNRARMDYPRYRMAGLPIGSALMESLVKEINRRVKGTEKSWNDPSGANPILALKAASLCEDNRLDKLLSV